MTNVFKLKNQHCIEWILGVRLPHDTRRVSESFIMQNVKCNLSFELNGAYKATLYIQSNLTLNPAINMIVIGTPNYRSYDNASTSFSKSTKFTGKRLKIWEHNLRYRMGMFFKFTFEVITLDINISKGKILKIINFFKKYCSVNIMSLITSSKNIILC